MKRNNLIYIFIILIIFFIILIFRNHIPGNKYISIETLPLFTLEELKKYNDDDPNLPIYISYNDLIYDVSAGRDEYYCKTCSYNYLTGKDSTELLDMFGGTLIKLKYPVVGKLLAYQ